MATSSAVKRKWNNSHYKEWRCQIKPELFDEIEEYCKNHCLSRREFLEMAIDFIKNENT